jgi:hypothetical protein
MRLNFSINQSYRDFCKKLGCIGYFRKVRKPCSGPCCGNPRKWFGELTIQELRAPKVADF